MQDQPKSLGYDHERRARLARLREPHIAPLTDFVERVRQERGCGGAFPYFDPSDAGVNARCLFVLEAPGPKAVESGFISRNNPDESAKNFFLINQEAGLVREHTVSCNIVPWFIGVAGKIRAATQQDLDEGWPYLLQLLNLLPNLQVIVLVGGKSQRIRHRLLASGVSIPIMDSPHPSPQFVNRKPENRGVLLSALKEVAARVK